MTICQVTSEGRGIKVSRMGLVGEDFEVAWCYGGLACIKPWK